MSLTIANNSNSNTYKTNFKGEWKQTDEGNPYYKTNSGLKAGAVLAIPAAFCWLSELKSPTTEEGILKESKTIASMYKFIKNPTIQEYIKKQTNEEELYKIGMEKIIERNKRAKKLAIPFAIIASGFSIGCGTLIDKSRNKKAQQVADSVKQYGLKNTIIQNDRVGFSNNGNAYYESNQGTKKGALLGAACGILHNAMLQKNKSNITDFIINSAIFAIGGLIMGKIADHNTNKDTKKHG